MSNSAILICTACIGLILITRVWFWVLAFLLSSIAAFFSMLASIVHLQILGAIGFLLLGILLWNAMLWTVAWKYGEKIIPAHGGAGSKNPG